MRAIEFGFGWVCQARGSKFGSLQDFTVIYCWWRLVNK